MKSPNELHAGQVLRKIGSTRLHCRLDRTIGFAWNDSPLPDIGRVRFGRTMKPSGYRRPVPSDSETYLTLRPPFGGIYQTEGPRMMNLKQEFDALIESTMAFANDVK